MRTLNQHPHYGTPRTEEPGRYYELRAYNGATFLGAERFPTLHDALTMAQLASVLGWSFSLISGVEA